MENCIIGTEKKFMLDVAALDGKFITDEGVTFTARFFTQSDSAVEITKDNCVVAYEYEETGDTEPQEGKEYYVTDDSITYYKSTDTAFSEDERYYEKTDAIRKGGMILCLDTSTLSVGKLVCRLTVTMPDEDFPDEDRVEIIDISTGLRMIR